MFVGILNVPLSNHSFLLRLPSQVLQLDELKIIQKNYVLILKHYFTHRAYHKFSNIGQVFLICNLVSQFIQLSIFYTILYQMHLVSRKLIQFMKVTQKILLKNVSEFVVYKFTDSNASTDESFLVWWKIKTQFKKFCVISSKALAARVSNVQC